MSERIRRSYSPILNHTISFVNRHESPTATFTRMQQESRRLMQSRHLFKPSAIKPLDPAPAREILNA